MAPNITTTLVGSERSLKIDGDADSVREVRARGKLQGKETQGRLPRGGGLSDLPNRLLYM